MRSFLLATLAAVLPSSLIQAQEQPPTAPPQSYVSLIVKACPADPGDVERCSAAAMGAQGLPNGYCPKAVAQGEGEEARQHSRSKEERNAYWAKIGCIDIPVPPDVIMGGDGASQSDMTMSQCIGHRGYLTAMQYLEMNQTITQKAVGGWVCIEQSGRPSGVASF
mgnify:CR=1 FL=1